MVDVMKRKIRMARQVAARSSFVQGLGSLLLIADAPRRPSRRRSEIEALRGDMEKLGMDMQRVMQRERVHEKASRKASYEPAE